MDTYSAIVTVCILLSGLALLFTVAALVADFIISPIIEFFDNLKH